MLDQEFVEFTSLPDLENELDEFEVGDMQTDEKAYLLKTRNLNSRMATEKTSFEYWLELMDIQNLAKNSIFHGKEKLIVEKKLSIIEKALENDSLKMNFYLKLLRIDLLRQKEESEDHYKMITREFNNLLQDMPDPDGQVLALYLAFRHSYFTNYSASFLRKNIKDFLVAYKEIVEGATSTSEIKKTEQLIYLVIVYGILTEMRMGFSEKAIGILIALTEFSIINAESLSKFSETWEDHRILKVGEENPSSKVPLSTIELQIMHALNLDSQEFDDQLYEKQAISYQSFVEKEIIYSKILWRPANSALDKVGYDHQGRIELDSYAVVLFDDIEEYMFQFFDADSKIKLIDFTLDLLGVGPQIMQNHSAMSLSQFSITKECLCADNRMYEVRDKTLRSPHLFSFSTFLSLILEKDLSVAQLSKFEFAVNYISKLRQVYSQSNLLLYIQFILEMAKSKSPYFQVIKANADIDEPFKRILKDHQDQVDLWIAFIEIEALLNPEQAFTKIESLSSKVLKSVIKSSSADVKAVRVSVMDLYFRLALGGSASVVEVLTALVQQGVQVVKDLGIQLATYAPELVDLELNKEEDASFFLSKHSTSFLGLSRLTEKLLRSVIQLTTTSAIETTIDSSFLNKKKSFSITDFTILTVVYSFFGVLSGQFDSQFVEHMMHDWVDIHLTKLNQISNIYVKQYRVDLLLSEVRSTVIILNNLMGFVAKAVPQRTKSLLQLNAGVYSSILPLDASLLSFIVAENITASYRFQLLENLKKSGVRFCFAETLAVLFELQRSDPVGTLNLQEYLLHLYSEKTVDQILLENLKVFMLEKEKNKEKRSVVSWFSHGKGIIYQNQALLTLQEILATRETSKSGSSATSNILKCIHKAPFNKV